MPRLVLHITVFRRRYPLYKYLVVAAVTLGVAVFTLHSGKKKGSKVRPDDASTAWGLLLLGINLLFDGLTNSTQDHIFQTFRPYSGPQMMCANNIMSTLVTGTYLIVSPWLVATGIGEWFGMDVAGSAGELKTALDFMARYPAVWKDVLGFAACGAVGQVFICESLLTPFTNLCCPQLIILQSSLYPLHLLFCPSRYCHRHSQDVYHDSFRPGLWSSPYADAMAWRRARLWGHRRRGWHCATGEDG